MNYKINKALVKLVSKLSDEVLLKIFFNNSEYIRDMITCKVNNHLIQELWERIENILTENIYKKPKFVLEEIVHMDVRRLLKNCKTFDMKLKVTGFEIRKWIRDEFLYNFESILNKKYAKYVVCTIISCNEIFDKRRWNSLIKLERDI